MVLATEIMIPPRRHSFNGPEPPTKSPPKSHWWFLTSKIKPAASYGGSHTVAIQKLRESKWFNQDEERLFCAVIESGFIVEIMLREQSVSDNKSHYGVVSVETKKSEFESVVIKQIRVICVCFLSFDNVQIKSTQNRHLLFMKWLMLIVVVEWCQKTLFIRIPIIFYM